MIRENCIKFEMRARLIQIGAMLILAVCIWGHVSEIFDHWDNTFQTGNDIEYSTVIVVLVAGKAIAFACAASLVLFKASITSYLVPVFDSHALAVPRAADFLGHSPPKFLRI